VPDDGSFDNEKWALLRQPWVHESDLLTVLQYEIDQQGLCPEAVVCLLERPILALTPKLRSIAGNPRKAQSQAIFALTLLQICGDDGVPQRLADLRRYFETPADQKAIDRIREKIQEGSAVEWSDLETLVHEW